MFKRVEVNIQDFIESFQSLLTVCEMSTVFSLQHFRIMLVEANSLYNGYLSSIMYRT